MVISASDEDLIWFGKIRLREAYRIIYTANYSMRSLEISEGISINRPGLEERSFLFSPLYGRFGSRQKRWGRSSSAASSNNRRAADRTWTSQLMYLSSIKKIPTPTEKVALQRDRVRSDLG